MKKLGGSSFFKGSRPEFEPGLAGAGSGVPKNASFLGWAVAAKLNKFSAGVPEDASSLGWGAGGHKCSGCPTPPEPIFESRAV